MSSEFAEQCRLYMLEAIGEAEKAASAGEVPVGCVIVKDGAIIAKAHNRRQQLQDPTAHAEILAIRMAAAHIGSRRLHGCTLYVTLEPCPMCAGAILMAEMEACYFGAVDTAQGCMESVYALTRDPAFYRQVPAYGGLLEPQCSEILRSFFYNKRGLYDN